MAEIEMERRPRRHGWTWLVLALVLVALGVGAWLLIARGGEAEYQSTPAAETRGLTEPDQPPVTVPRQPTVPGDTFGFVPGATDAGTTTDESVRPEPLPRP